MKKIFRAAFKNICRLYPKEHGRYTILMKYYFPYLAPKSEYKEKTILRNDIVMNLELTEYVQAYLYLFGCYEISTIKFFERFLQKGDVVLDVGANVGFQALTFAKLVGSTGTVHAFEPETINYDLLCKNIKINPGVNIVTNKFALSSVTGKLKLFLSKDNNAGTHSTVFNPNTLSGDFIEIDAMKVDDYVADKKVPKVDLVKIDVEGGELDVINGMDETLKQHKPCLMVEMVGANQTLRGISTSELKKMMKDKYGYDSYKTDEDGLAYLISLDLEHDSDNVIFIHETKKNLLKNIVKNE